MPTITIAPGTTHQTMAGWEATGVGPLVADDPNYPTYKAYLFDQAIFDLGIDRLRIEVIQRANGQAHFDLVGLDNDINRGVLPLRTRSASRGESLWLNFCVVGSGHTSGGATQYWANNPASYAAAVLECYQHMQATFGFIPSSWEVALEPDNFVWGTGTQLGNALKAAGDAVSGAGFPTYFVAPSHTAVYDVPFDFDQMVAVSGAAAYLRELSFHGYGGYAPTDIAAIVSRANAYGLKTSMLEHIGDTHLNLYDLLVNANLSAYSQYTLAYPTSDDGAQYYTTSSGATPADMVHLSAYAKYFRQYFKYVRRGAVRVGASSSSGTLKPVAFRNTSGTYAIVVEASGGLSFDVTGVPDGTYGVKSTTGTSVGAYDVDGPDAIATGGLLSTSIAAAGTITIYSKSGSSVPPPITPVFYPPPIIAVNPAPPPVTTIPDPVATTATVGIGTAGLGYIGLGAGPPPQNITRQVLHQVIFGAP